MLNRLVAVHEATGSPLVAAEYGGTVGVPALFARSVWPEILALPPSAGAKQILARHAAQVQRVPFPGGAIDIDTAEDYERLLGDLPDDQPRAGP